MAAAPVLQHFEHPITVTIQGAVIDDLGDAVKGAAVNVLFGGNSVGRADTGDDGAFNMKELQLKTGAHILRTYRPGYAPSKETLLVTEDMANTTRLVTLRLNLVGWENASLTAEDLKFDTGRLNERRSRNQKYVSIEVFLRQTGNINRSKISIRGSEGSAQTTMN
jgi:hypothetical protein